MITGFKSYYKYSKTIQALCSYYLYLQETPKRYVFLIQEFYKEKELKISTQNFSLLLETYYELSKSIFNILLFIKNNSFYYHGTEITTECVHSAMKIVVYNNKRKCSVVDVYTPKHA